MQSWIQNFDWQSYLFATATNVLGGGILLIFVYSSKRIRSRLLSWWSTRTDAKRQKIQKEVNRIGTKKMSRVLLEFDIQEYHYDLVINSMFLLFFVVGLLMLVIFDQINPIGDVVYFGIGFVAIGIGILVGKLSTISSEVGVLYEVRQSLRQLEHERGSEDGGTEDRTGESEGGRD